MRGWRLGRRRRRRRRRQGKRRLGDGIWTSTSQLPISMVVPATHVPALALLRSLPASSAKGRHRGLGHDVPSSQVLLLRFLAAFRLA